MIFEIQYKIEHESLQMKSKSKNNKVSKINNFSSELVT